MACVDDPLHHELVARLEEVQPECFAGKHGLVVEERGQAELELMLLRRRLAHPSLQQLGEQRLRDVRDHHVLWLIFRPASPLRQQQQKKGHAAAARARKKIMPGIVHDYSMGIMEQARCTEFYVFGFFHTSYFYNSRVHLSVGTVDLLNTIEQQLPQSREFGGTWI